MLKKIFFVPIIMIVFADVSFAQIFNGSIIVEGAGLLTEVKHYSGTWPNNDVDSYQIESGVGLYWSGKWKLDSLYQMELRLGWFLSSEYFRSKQIGLYVRRMFGRNYIGAIGLNTILHYGGSGSTTIPDGGNHELNLSFGKKITDEILLHITIGKTINNNYGGAKLHWLAKLGVEWDF